MYELNSKKSANFNAHASHSFRFQKKHWELKNEYFLEHSPKRKFEIKKSKKIILGPQNGQTVFDLDKATILQGFLLKPVNKTNYGLAEI